MSNNATIPDIIEVQGHTFISLLKGLGGLRSIGETILNHQGITHFKAENWYPFHNAVLAFNEIRERTGPVTLTKIGRLIPEVAIFPPDINDIFSALSVIDMAYHLNHRKNGEIMYNPKSGKMLEGIGHYQYVKIAENKIEMHCDTPYPCDFDLGIIEAMANKYKPKDAVVRLTHTNNDPCRINGFEKCIYHIHWL